jgi:hypothetical protein
MEHLFQESVSFSAPGERWIPGAKKYKHRLPWRHSAPCEVAEPPVVAA